MNSGLLREFQGRIGYSFMNAGLLENALVHSSFSNEMQINKKGNNERLEFLGDAVLELIVSDYLYKKYKDMTEGELSKLRASHVCEQYLAYCARAINIGDALLLGKGEEATGGRDRDSILSDAFEAVIGAIYLDGGFEKAGLFINRFVISSYDSHKNFRDSKSRLQEVIQNEYKEQLTYRLVAETGPDHNKTFEVTAYMGDTPLKSGKGRTKKAAEQEAAYNSLLSIK